MKNIVTLSIVSIFTTLVFVGCSATSPSVESHSSESHLGTTNNENLTQKKVHNIIKYVGEENGWIMTEFKNNVILGEKPNGNDSKAVTITFDESSFDISPSDSDLESAISDALK
jgi:hypothetical protein